jgi:phosphatidylserine/phosphatidylglycerophosphate/cardiolipin synthase-like enzyme
VHNKGVIVDNKSVLISSVNWNENSVTRNREVGIIIENDDVANYYSNVFLYDWNLSFPKSHKKEIEAKINNEDNKNTIYIVVIFTLTFALIARDWRKRQWT